MKNKIRKATLWAFIFIAIAGKAQNTRISDHNTIGWYNYFGTYKLSDKVGIHTEYQFRRDNLINDWMQSLLRVGVNYQIHPKVSLRLGYAWIETWPYGDIPINRFGKQFTEHRAFQMATITDKVGRVDLSHRFMLEQRWIGTFSSADLKREDDFTYINRFRYMFRMQVPLLSNAAGKRSPFIAMYDEIFIGFGKNVGANVFDQNRLGILIGYPFSNTFRLEGGFLNQIVQLGRLIDQRNVFQYNNGFIMNAIFNIDLSKSVN
jgi:hypothetical protein